MRKLAARPTAVERAPVDPLGRDSLLLRLATGRVGASLTILGWALLILGTVFLCGQFFRGVNPQDEGEMLTYPWLIAQGRVLYVDIWAMYPPAAFVLIAVPFKLGVPGLLAERGVGVLARLLCVLMLNRAVTGAWRRFSWLLTPMSFALFFLAADISIAAYPWLVGLPALLLGLLCVRSDRLWPAALLFFLAATFRLEFGIAGLVALGVVACFRTFGASRRLDTWRPLAALVGATVLFYLLLNALTSGQALRDSVLDPVLHIEPYRRVAFFPPIFGPFGVPAALALLLGPPAMVLVGLGLRRPAIAATNLAVCTLLPQVVQDADWGHLFGVAALGVPWVALSVVDVLRPAPSLLDGDRALPLSPAGVAWAGLALAWMTGIVGGVYGLFVIAYALVASPLAPAGPIVAGRGPENVVGSGQRMIVARTAVEARDGRALLAYVNGHRAAGDRVFIAPIGLRAAEYNMTALYYALGLPPASTYLEMNPGLETTARVQREITRDLRSCRWVVVWKDPGMQGNPIPGSAVLERYLQRNYGTVYENETYLLLSRRGR